MGIREALAAALTERFADRPLRIGAPPGPVAIFPAEHPEVGDVRVMETGIDGNFVAIVAVGDILSDHFQNYDNHLETDERVARLTNEVVRFLQELFADRLLLWRSTDDRNAGWRERGDASPGDVSSREPLVLDNRTYRTCRWSGPLGLWQAAPAILARGRIRDDREYVIVCNLLQEAKPGALDEAERDLARRLAADYERERAD